LLLPMLAAVAAAMLVPTLFGARPIYDVLKERTLALEAGLKPDSGRESPSSPRAADSSEGHHSQ